VTTYQITFNPQASPTKTLNTLVFSKNIHLRLPRKNTLTTSYNSFCSGDLDHLIFLLIQQTTFISMEFYIDNFHMREYSLEHEHSIILWMFEPSFHDKSSHFKFFFFTLCTHKCTHISFLYEQQQDEWKVFLRLKYLEEENVGGNKFIHKC